MNNKSTAVYNLTVDDENSYMNHHEEPSDNGYDVDDYDDEEDDDEEEEEEEDEDEYDHRNPWRRDDFED